MEVMAKPLYCHTATSTSLTVLLVRQRLTSYALIGSLITCWQFKVQITLTHTRFPFVSTM